MLRFRCGRKKGDLVLILMERGFLMRFYSVRFLVHVRPHFDATGIFVELLQRSYEAKYPPCGRAGRVSSKPPESSSVKLPQSICYRLEGNLYLPARVERVNLESSIVRGAVDGPG